MIFKYLLLNIKIVLDYFNITCEQKNVCKMYNVYLYKRETKHINVIIFYIESNMSLNYKKL